MKVVSKDNPVIAWWSGGVTSAVACKICIDWFGEENVRIVFIDTKNEDPSTYLFKSQCEKWYKCKIESISSSKYENIQEVWYHFVSLNVATGAICSTILKKEVREAFQKANRFSYQAFGYDTAEPHRAQAMMLNYPECYPIFPLLGMALSKKRCINIVEQANNLFLEITIPRTYKLGYNNNNCFITGCIQGGIGYWQKIKVDDIDKYNKMGKVEHDLTDIKGKPVTINKDQSKGGGLVFLLPHPKYPEVKDLSMMKGRPPKPLVDCNGYCGIEDLSSNKETENEINYQLE